MRYEKPVMIKRPRLSLWRRVWLRFAGVRAFKNYLSMISLKEYEDEIRPVFSWERDK